MVRRQSRAALFSNTGLARSSLKAIVALLSRDVEALAGKHRAFPPLVGQSRRRYGQIRCDTPQAHKHMFYTAGMCDAGVAVNPLDALLQAIQGFVSG